MGFKKFACLFILLSIFFMSVECQAVEYREVSASSILYLIENDKDIHFVNCRITGYLDLSNVNLEEVPNPYGKSFFGPDNRMKIVESRILIKDSIIEQSVNFSNTQFQGFVSFENTSFIGKINFKASNFNNYLSFEHAVFYDLAEFTFSNFNGNANFVSSVFKDDAYFGGIMEDSSIFSSGESVVFNQELNFNNAVFCGEANFEGTDFRKVYFNNAHFCDDAFFFKSFFAESADFSNANFSGNSLFSEAEFKNETIFRDTKFNDAYFINSKFNDVDFSKTSFSTVSLNGTDFNKMEARWPSFEHSLVFDDLLYLKLIHNFRTLDQFEDEDDVYFMYRKRLQSQKSWLSFSKWTAVLMWITCGYGVKPFRAFVLGGLIVLIFSFIYLGRPTISLHNGENIGRIHRLLPESLRRFIPNIDWLNPGISRLTTDENPIQEVSLFDAFYFSMVTFATIGYGDWYPEDKFRKWVMIEGFLGWLILGLFLVTLTNVMIRP